MRFLLATGRRVLYAVVLLLAVIVLNFLLIHLAPGDSADVIASAMGGATKEMLEQIRHTYGLDKSVPEQLLIYLGKMIRGDLGYSHYFNAPVMELILHRVPATFLLVVSSQLVSISLGIFLGVVASLRPNGLLSHFVNLSALVFWAAPVFWSGLMILILFASIIPLFPVSGMFEITRVGGAFTRVLDVAHHLFLPMLTLALLYLALYSRLARASMLEVLNSDYIRTARAKGMSERTIIYRHALRNAVLPVVTMVGLQISRVFAGAVLVETVFNWPGLGRLAFDSILRRDIPTILGILLFSTLMVVVMNILTDLSYRLIDPRIQLETK
jgi:peptide/nickel transport system permease protein